VHDLTTNDYKSTFRPDIQALRALAVVLVLMFHASIPGFHAGFLGVDVFFVISGFVITGVLLQERAGSGGTSILDFYARRIRRILPAASVVIVLTIFATYHWLAFVTGASVAGDAKWVTAFMGNFHFATVGTQYFGASNPPSTLTQFWSLGVEEQFYVVWPVMFLVLARSFSAIRARNLSVNGAWALFAVALTKIVMSDHNANYPQWSKQAINALLLASILLLAVGLLSRIPNVRIRLVSALSILMGASLIFNFIQTKNNPVWAFYSPLTRAWELGLGALLAVLTPYLVDKAPKLGTWFGIVGCAVIGACTWFYSSQTAATEWPGWRAILPVAATGLVIAGGSLRQSTGFGVITKFPVIQWVGAISFSLYLVHYPIIQIATQYSFTPLSGMAHFEQILLSFALAAVSYYLLEQPVRKSTFFKNHRWATYVLGAALIAATYGAIFWHLHNSGA